MISAMKNSISEVLETMFFLPIDFSDASGMADLWKSPQEALAAARIHFSGPLSGHFLFVVPLGLALSTTAGFLGEDLGSVSREHAHETVKEIANMVAGNTFSRYDDQAVFNLGIPELLVYNDLTENPGGSGERVFIGCNTLEDRLAFELVVRD